MIRHLPLILLTAVLLTACERTAEPEPAGDVLRVYVPHSRLDPAIPAQFQRVTGVEVIIVDDPQALCDLRIVPGGTVPDLVASHAIQPIDPAQVPNASHLAPRFQDPPYDRGNAYSLPYRWGTIGLMYRQDQVPDFEPSWNMVFAAAEHGHSVALFDEQPVMLAVALKFLGHSANTTEAEARQAAADLLAGTQALPNVQPAAGARGAAITVTSSAAAHRAMEEDDNLRFAIPREGSVLRVGVMVIASDARRSDLAHRFIDYLLDPQIGAQLANESGASTPNQTAMPYITPQDRADPGLYPPAQVMDSLEVLSP